MQYRNLSRGVFAVIGLVAIGSGAAASSGCASDADLIGPSDEQPASEEAALHNQSVTFVVLDTADIPADGYDFSDSTEKREHCYVSAALTASFPAGTQIRIATGSHLGLCTVQHNAAGPTCPGGTTPCYRVGVHSELATKRLGMSSPAIGDTVSGTASDEATMGTISVANHQSWPAAFTSVHPSNDVHEYRINPNTAIVAYTAPHGRIEADTASQVDFILEDADADGRNAGWVAQYGTSAGNHFDHFHITAGDLSEASFPDLDLLFDLRASALRYAVAFHGFNESNYSFDDLPAMGTCDTNPDKCAHVLVGGDEDLLFRRGVAELLNEVLPSNYRARAEGFTASLWGTDNSNFVNRLAAHGLGLQLEQSGYVRTNHGETVANTVQSVYDCLIDTVDVARVTAANGGTAASGGTGYTSGRCPRFIAEVQPSTPSITYTFNAGIDNCSSAGSAHVDYYRESGSPVRWRRIGGGRIDYTYNGVSCTATKASGTGFTEPSGADAQAGTFRAVVRSTSSGGAAQQAFFSVTP